MPNLNALIPDDLELLRVGLSSVPPFSVCRYTLSGREGEFYCLVRDRSALDAQDLEATLRLYFDHCESTEVETYTDEAARRMGVVWTNKFVSDSPASDAHRELTRVTDDFSLDGTIRELSMISPEELDAASRLTERQIGNIQMAYDRTNPGSFLPAARLLAGHDLNRWHAFEVCEAVSDSVPMEFTADIANPELTFQQARGLRHLAYIIMGGNMQSDERIRSLFHKVALRTDFSEGKIRAIGSVLKATPRFEFEEGWLDLSTDQLRSVRLAQRENVPPSVLHRYAGGEYPAENMDILTLATRDGEIKGPQLNRLLDPDLSLGQLVEAWAAATDCSHGKLSLAAFDLICDPQLPQPTMNALRIGLTYYDMPYNVAATVTPSTTPELGPYRSGT